MLFAASRRRERFALAVSLAYGQYCFIVSVRGLRIDQLHRKDIDHVTDSGIWSLVDHEMKLFSGRIRISEESTCYNSCNYFV